MNKTLALVASILLGLASTRVVEAGSEVVLEYREDDQHHVQSGVPGQQVEGEYGYKAPEGDNFVLQYKAGEEGYLAEGDHLPSHPEETEEVAVARGTFAEAMRIAEEIADESFDIEKDYSPLCSQATADVEQARAEFKAAYMKAVATGVDVEEVENEVEVEVERRRRSADAQFLYHLPSTYSYYPQYNYNYRTAYPVVNNLPYYQVNGFHQPVLSVGHPIYTINYPFRSIVTVPSAPVTVPVTTTVTSESSDNSPIIPNSKIPGEDEPAALAF